MKRLFTALVLGLMAATTNAAIIDFELSDSQYGNARPPTYGLRLDGLYSGNASDIYTFSFVDVTMSVDTVANTAVLGGDLLGGSENNGEARNVDWSFTFTYTGLDVDNDGSWEFVNGTSGGSGSITNLDTADIFQLIEFMGSDGFGPRGDGGPCRSADGPWCGNGWLNHSIDPESPPSDWRDIHLAASDFLYVGTPVSVPEPSSLALLGFGLLGLGVARRRKQAA